MSNVMGIRKMLLILVLVMFFVGTIIYFSKNQDKGINIVTTSNYLIEIGNKKLLVDSKQWKFVDNSGESNYSKNYSAIDKKDSEMFQQIITIYLNKMTDDRKIGEKITNSEYIDSFVVYPNLVTIQIRVDKGDYWVMSRQTFKIKTNYPNQTNIPFSDLQHISLDTQDKINQTMQNQIDNTRYVLNSYF